MVRELSKKSDFPNGAILFVQQNVYEQKAFTADPNWTKQFSSTDWTDKIKKSKNGPTIRGPWIFTTFNEQAKTQSFTRPKFMAYLITAGCYPTRLFWILSGLLRN